MSFLKGYVSYLAAAALLIQAVVDAINDDWGAAFEKGSMGLAAFGIRRSIASVKETK